MPPKKRNHKPPKKNKANTGTQQSKHTSHYKKHKKKKPNLAPVHERNPHKTIQLYGNLSANKKRSIKPKTLTATIGGSVYRKSELIEDLRFEKGLIMHESTGYVPEYLAEEEAVRKILGEDALDKFKKHKEGMGPRFMRVNRISSWINSFKS